MKIELFSTRNAVRYAWTGWAALFVVTAAIIAAGSHRSVVINYREAALDWIAGRGLYNFSGIGGFVYFPQAAILFAPFALLPEVAGEVLWRLVTVGVLAAGLLGFARLLGERSGKELFPLMTLAAIPLAWDCARNGQSTLAMTGLMLLAVVDIARSRWWRATLWLALAVAIKPLAIVLVLLVMAIDRPMRWRALAGMAVLALSPFAMQHPAYVMQQYAGFLKNSTIAAHVAVVARGWSSPFNALQMAGVRVPEAVQTAIRLVAAVGTLALCWVARRRHDAARSAAFVFSLSVVYLLLFSPRTETNTYAMLGPAVGAFLALAYLVEKRFPEGNLVAVIGLVAAGNRRLKPCLRRTRNQTGCPPSWPRVLPCT